MMGEYRKLHFSKGNAFVHSGSNNKRGSLLDVESDGKGVCLMYLNFLLRN